MEFAKKNKVLVIGDIILDQYYTGEAARISPEAPVPVLNVRERRSVLGGAANVANNISALGGEVCLAGIIGEDEQGREIVHELNKNRIGSELVKFDTTIHTITKTRVMSGNQQIVRLDCHDDDKPETEIMEQMMICAKEAVKDHDIVVISDYAKGVCSKMLCQEIIQQARLFHKPVIVDPKGSQWEKYRGADVMTPNVKEIGSILGRAVKNTNDVIEQNCACLLSKSEIPYLIVTRSEKGMTLCHDNRFTHFPSMAKEVYDVSGAGDVVVAVIALYFNIHNDIDNVIRAANMAAGMAVGKSGTATVKEQELIQAYTNKEEKGLKQKLRTLQEALVVVGEWRKAGKTIVFTNGCFDLIHKGHITTLAKAADMGDYLIVAINTDRSVKRLKGSSRPINSEADRALILSALSFVDMVIIFDENTPEEIIRCIKPDILVKGGDYEPDKVAGARWVGKVEIVEYKKGYSTTEMIQRAEKQKSEEKRF